MEKFTILLYYKIYIYFFIVFKKIFFFSFINCLNMDDSLLVDIESKKVKLTYECFGAVGDGKTNDYFAIKDAHDFANMEYAKKGIFLTVYATSGKTYYLGSNRIDGKSYPITVITDVDWQGANFIVDDTESSVDTTKSLFNVVSLMSISTGRSIVEYKDDISSEVWKYRNIPKNSNNLKSLVDVILNDNKIMRSPLKNYFYSANVIALAITDGGIKFYRSANTSNAYNKTELILIDKNTGEVLNDVENDYSDVTRIRVWPIPNRPISIKNATFITRTFNEAVNLKDTSNPYVQRNIYINFTGNINVSNVKHFLDENYKKNNNQNNPIGNAYYGFIRLYNSAYIKLNNLALTPHHFAKYNNGKNPYGTYDLTFDMTSYLNIDGLDYACDTDPTDCYNNTMVNDNVWGLIGSNESKNVFITDSRVNRIDAHRGIRNLYISDTTIGSKGLVLTGSNYFYAKNLIVDRADQIIELRKDYGSSWDGVVVLNNIKYIVSDNSSSPTIITSMNEQKNYGYNNYFPELYIKYVTIDTKTYNSSKNAYIISFYESTSSNAPYKYSFKGNINLVNINLDKKLFSSNALYLFKDSFIKDNNISINSYENLSKINIDYNRLNRSFKYASKSSDIDKLKNCSLFSFSSSNSTNLAVDSKINEVETFFRKLIASSNEISNSI